MAFPSHRPQQIEFIQQRNRSDCGTACVAMLAGLMYDTVRSLMRRSRGGSYPDDVLEVLEDLGFEWREVSSLPGRGGALVALQWRDEQYGGHYVVWDSRRKQFLDPLHGVVGKRDMMKHAAVDHIWTVVRKKPAAEENPT